MDVVDAHTSVDVTDIVSAPPAARMITAVAYASAYATDLPVTEIQYMEHTGDNGEPLFGGRIMLADKEIMIVVMLDKHDDADAQANLSVEVDGVDVDWSGWFDPVLEEVTSAVVAAITNYINSLSNTSSFTARLAGIPQCGSLHFHGRASVVLARSCQARFLVGISQVRFLTRPLNPVPIFPPVWVRRPHHGRRFSLTPERTNP